MRVKSDDASFMYCRCGDQKIQVGSIKQESDGKVSSVVGSIAEIFLRGM